MINKIYIKNLNFKEVIFYKIAKLIQKKLSNNIPQNNQNNNRLKIMI